MTEQQTPPPAKLPKEQSRSDRWSVAAGEAADALSQMLTHMDDLENALAALKEIQDEYAEWNDSLPENLRNSPVGEKLEAVCEINFEDIGSTVCTGLEEAEGQIQEAKDIELPRGFGKD